MVLVAVLMRARAGAPRSTRRPPTNCWCKPIAVTTTTNTATTPPTNQSAAATQQRHHQELFGHYTTQARKRPQPLPDPHRALLLRKAVHHFNAAPAAAAAAARARLAGGGGGGGWGRKGGGAAADVMARPQITVRLCFWRPRTRVGGQARAAMTIVPLDSAQQTTHTARTPAEQQALAADSLSPGPRLCQMLADILGDESASGIVALDLSGNAMDDAAVAAVMDALRGNGALQLQVCLVWGGFVVAACMGRVAAGGNRAPSGSLPLPTHAPTHSQIKLRTERTQSIQRPTKRPRALLHTNAPSPQ